MKLLTHGFTVFLIQLVILYYTSSFWLFVGVAFLTGVFITKQFNFFSLFGIELVAMLITYLLSSPNSMMLLKFSEISTLSPWLYGLLVVVITATLFASISGTLISYRKAREIED